MSVTVTKQLYVKEITAKVKQALETGMWDCIDDLQRTASDSAPHLEGILDGRSWAKDVHWSSATKIEGTVVFSVKEGNEDWNGFNYALKMHEDDYQLGEKSKAKPGGTGMSGTKYPVGKKYLTNPLYGEAETYKNHLQEMVNQAVK
jgi:hypothetical protein